MRREERCHNARPLAIGVLQVVAEHHGVPPSAQARRTRSTMSPGSGEWGRRTPPWWRCGRSGASPHRGAANSPCSSIWQTAKERAVTRRLAKDPHARDRGQGDGGAGACELNQVGFRHQFVEEHLGVLLVPGPGGFPRRAGSPA